VTFSEGTARRDSSPITAPAPRSWTQPSAENTQPYIQLTFGVRADLRTLVFGTYTCDTTVLVRGTSGVVCPL